MGNSFESEDENKATSYTKAELTKLLTAEGDKRVNQALKSFKEKELPELIEKAKADAEKDFTASARQKAESERLEMEKAISEREQELCRREIMFNAKQELLNRKLPESLIGGLNLSSPQTLNESLGNVERDFNQAVETAVNAKLKSVPAPKSGRSISMDEQINDLFNAKR